MNRKFRKASLHVAATLMALAGTAVCFGPAGAAPSSIAAIPAPPTPPNPRICPGGVCIRIPFPPYCRCYLPRPT